MRGGCCPCSCSYLSRCSSLAHGLRDGLFTFMRDYDRLQYIAVILIYIQIGCALIGSLGALYNGVLLINLGIALFALVAIESSSQSLGRTYAVLLFCSILVDISWFILFTREIWNISSQSYGAFFIFSVRLTMAMEIIGFSVRLSSSLLWIQIYRLGVPCVDGREGDYDLRHSFLSPANPAVVGRTISECDDVLGGAIYDPTYYSSLFEDGQDNKRFLVGQNDGIVEHGSTSGVEGSQLKTPLGRSGQFVDNVLFFTPAVTLSSKTIPKHPVWLDGLQLLLVLVPAVIMPLFKEENSIGKAETV